MKAQHYDHMQFTFCLYLFISIYFPCDWNVTFSWVKYRTWRPDIFVYLFSVYQFGQNGRVFDYLCPHFMILNKEIPFRKFFKYWSSCHLKLHLNVRNCPLNWRHIVVPGRGQIASSKFAQTDAEERVKTFEIKIAEKMQVLQQKFLKTIWKVRIIWSFKSVRLY